MSRVSFIFLLLQQISIFFNFGVGEAKMGGIFENGNDFKWLDRGKFMGGSEALPSIQ
jgi:hypothetical protein